MATRNRFLIITLCLILAFSFTACEPEPDSPTPDPTRKDNVKLFTAENGEDDAVMLVGSTIKFNPAAVSDGKGTAPVVKINNNTGDTYTIVFDDAGKPISVEVAYDNGVFKDQSAEIPTPVLTLTLSSNTDGKVLAGETTLELKNPTWTTDLLAPGYTPPVPTYSWSADGTTISGATNATFTVTDTQMGRTITGTGTHTASSISGTQTAADKVAINVKDGNNRTVTIKDDRTNPEQTLKDLGIITKLTTLLGSAVANPPNYVKIIDEHGGLTVLVEDVADEINQNYRAINWNTVGANLTFVKDIENIAGATRDYFTLAINKMAASDTVELTKAMPGKNAGFDIDGLKRQLLATIPTSPRALSQRKSA